MERNRDRRRETSGERNMGVPPIGTKKKKKEVKKKIRKSRPFFLTFKLGEDLFGWPVLLQRINIEG